jgi:hypothetical protein
MSYAEAIVAVISDADRSKVQTWFERKGFQTIPMRMGMLITGDQEVFRQLATANSEDVSVGVGRDVSLSIPADLADAVSSITIRRTPSIDG